MKKWILIICILLTAAVLAPAKEYSYLEPPTISVMDFEVNIEEPLVEGNPVSKQYFGELINHTLVTVLIQKNNEFGLIIPRHPHYPELNYADANETRQGPLKTDAEYFPPLLKIYDKKYVETALAQNNFTVNDLYTKAPEAFNFPELDFVVLGNVFEYENDKIALNIRVLNTYRGEELFAYNEFIYDDMHGLYEACDLIAHKIIIDILTNYCSQVMFKSIQFANPNEYDTPEAWADAQGRISGSNPYQLFLQSQDELDNTGEVIPANDTFKKHIKRDQYYFVLPGTYILTIYNEVKQSYQEIPVEIAPRDIRIVQLKEEHLETLTGRIVITNWNPTDAFEIEINEMERDAKFLWEVGNDNLGDSAKPLRRNFKDGEFMATPGTDATGEEGEENSLEPVWLYNAARQEISISRLPLQRYSVRLTPLPDNISKENIFGILRISSKGIEKTDALDADLRYENEVILDIEDFGVTFSDVEDAFQTTRVTFLIPEAFEMGWIRFGYTEGDREGRLFFWNYEKLVVEGSYTEEQWNDFVNIQFELEGGDTGRPRLARFDFPKEEIEAERDKIVVVELKEYQASQFTVDAGEEKRTFGDFLNDLFGGKK